MAVSASIRFRVDGVAVDVVAPPHTTVLEWLRASGRVGTKEGCAEGDCGACSVVIVENGAIRAINSCLVLLPQIARREIFTVEGLAPGARELADLHPAQRAMVEGLGSQCGYCTPGFVMTVAEATHRTDLDAAWKLDDQLCGNLCRCTGYRPIREAAGKVAGCRPDDAISRALAAPAEADGPVDVAVGGERYVAPDTLAGVWAALEAPEARIVCGATDLGLDVTQRRARFAHLVDLSRVAELRGIRQIPGGIEIGAATPLTDIEAAAATAMPVLHRMLRYFGSRQIKHRGTIGGNLCTASPIGDLAPVMLALDAELVVASAAGERVVPMDGWFLGYRKTALRPGEILAAVRLKAPPPDARVAAYKVSRRRELDISAVSAAFRVDTADGVVTLARFAFGGMAATTARATAAEDLAIGRQWDLGLVEALAAAVGGAFAPMSDHRGTAWYRSTVAANLVRGFFTETLDAPQTALPDGHAGTVIA